MYRGDLARDGHPSSATLDAAGASRLTLSWQVRLDGAVDGTPAVADGRVFVGSGSGTLAALDARTGATLWAKEGLGKITDSPTVTTGHVLVGSLTGHMYAFEASSGDPVWDWQAPPDAAVWASPVFYRGLVIVGLASPYGDNPLVPGRLVGLDAVTGHERWSSCVRASCAPGGGVWSTPAIDEHGLAFVGIGNPDDGVLAFNPMNGATRWVTSLYPDLGRDLDVGATPVVFELGGREVVGQATAEGMFAILDAATGSIVWSREIVSGSAVHGLIGSPAYDGKAIFAVSASRPTALFKLDPSTGSAIWRRDAAMPIYSAPALGDGVVVFGSGAVFGDLTHGLLLALSTSDGRQLWTYDMRNAVRSGPAIAGKLVVAGDYGGDVMGFRPSA